MPFSQSIRIEALVNSCRRCCVCHCSNGVGVEIHHIIQQASGGDNTIDNAIALCFDCHCAAGHYNPKHPRGTKYSPQELRKHRDNWWALLKEAGTADPSPEDLPDYHVRYLMCMDYDAAGELLNFQTENIPFDFDNLVQNNVATFMRYVLSDDLPFINGEPGCSYWGEGSYETLSSFHQANPNFRGNKERAIEIDDFGPKGIKSKVLLQCFQEGLSGEQLGRAVIHNTACGGPSYNYYYSVRRPVFVFAHIINHSEIPITIKSTISSSRDANNMSPIPYDQINADQGNRRVAPLRLEPSQSLIIPQMVMLTDPHHDDYRVDWSEYTTLPTHQCQDFGFRNGSSSQTNNYCIIGPYEKLSGFIANYDLEDHSFPAHNFDPNRCYMIARYWEVGSCPHIFFQRTDDTWSYEREILTNAYQSEQEEKVIIPAGVSRMRVNEIEVEISVLSSLRVNGLEQLLSPVTLQRGDTLDVLVEGGDQVVIRGQYFAAIPHPCSPAHIRQKYSMLKAAQNTYLIEKVN